MTRLAAAVSAAVVALGCAGDGPASPPRACTLIGCEDGYHVDLEPASGWPEGEYRFSIDLDGTPVSCLVSIPLPACGSGLSSRCEPSGMVTIVESGCGLPANTQGFPQVRFQAALRPRRVGLSIVRTHGGADHIVASADLTPRFETARPNGPDCLPVCTQARDRLTLRF